jgi:membrane-associated phospholipid phosphatase
VVLRYRLPRPAVALVLLQLVSVWFAIVYGGEHYLSDVIAGALVAVVAVWLVGRYRERVAEAIRRPSQRPPAAVGEPEVVVVRTTVGRPGAAQTRD